MTPRLPLLALGVAAAALASPASAAAVQPGAWSASGTAGVASANLSGPVTWVGGTSSCSVSVSGARGFVSCSGGTAFGATCAGTATPASVTLACVDTARRLHVEVGAALLPTGRFAGTISYERA